MVDINGVNDVSIPNPVVGVTPEAESGRIDSEGTLRSLSSSGAVSSLTKSEEAQALAAAMGAVSSSYVEQVVNKAESAIETLRRLFFLLVSQPKGAGVGEPELEEVVEYMPQTAAEVLKSLEAQHEDSSAYFGKFFDVLRGILNEHEGNEPLRESAIELLRNYDSHINARDCIESIMVNMEKLTKSTILKSQEGPIREILEAFVQKFPMPEKLSSKYTSSVLANLKSAVIPELKEALASNKTNFFARGFLMAIIKKTVELENGGEDTLYRSLDDFVNLLSGYEKLTPKFRQELHELLKEAVRLSEREPKDQFTNKMLNIISKVASNKTPTSAKTVAGNMLNSLVASQSSTISLLNFMLPLASSDGVAFAQVWVDPDAKKEQGSAGEKPRSGKKIFCRIDVELIGGFEVIIFAGDDGRIDCTLTCPEHVAKPFAKIKQRILEIVKEGGFSAGSLEVKPGGKERTKLNEVFPEINSRRGGVNVKV